MESTELKESKKNKNKKEKKEYKKIKKSIESKSKSKKKKKSKKDKKKDKKNNKERKTKSELKDPNEEMFLNKKIKLLEEQLKDKTNNLNNNNLNNSLNYINNFDISLKKPFHTLNYHKYWVLCLSILNDGRLISGSADRSIIIYNKTTYKPDLIINEHKGFVLCIIQLSSGILATCSNDETIKLFNIKGNNYNIIQTLNDHTGWIYKMIEIKNKYLVSCSDDKYIIFYLKDNLEYKKDYQISANTSCYCIFQIKENEICYSEYINYKDKICFFDLNERKIKSSISNISNSGYNPFVMISNDLLLILGNNKISIININYYELIREIEVSNSGWIYGACVLNKNILFIGDEKGIIKKLKIEEDNLILISKIEKAHNNWIYTLLNIGNGHFASGSADKLIKIW